MLTASLAKKIFCRYEHGEPNIGYGNLCVRQKFLVSRVLTHLKIYITAKKEGEVWITKKTNL